MTISGTTISRMTVRRVSELTLEQLRGNRETLLSILSTMRHDPLVL